MYSGCRRVLNAVTPTGTSGGDWPRMRQSEDWVQYMIDLPLPEPPGTRFEYCNGASFLLTAIIEKTTGETGVAFAKEHLFTPLGIKDIYWPTNIHGQTIGWGRLHLRPRDMARFGYLFLKQWKLGEGRQLVSAHWVADATRKHVSATPVAGYGYQWWVMSPERYAAMGYRGQRIVVLKDKNMVVVFTGRLKGKDLSIPDGTPERLYPSGGSIRWSASRRQRSP